MCTGDCRSVAGLLLQYSGYVGDAATQTSAALTAIKAMYVYIPLILLVCSIITMTFYRLDKDYDKIKAELDERRKNAAEENKTEQKKAAREEVSLA